MVLLGMCSRLHLPTDHFNTMTAIAILEKVPYAKLYDAVQALDEAGVISIAKDGCAILKKCILDGEETVARELLTFINSNGSSVIDPSPENNAVFYWAATKGMLKLVNALLKDPRVHPDEDCSEEADNITPLRSACWDGHVAVVKRLLTDERVDPTSKNNQAMQNAITKGQIGVVELLLTDGRADPNFAVVFALLSSTPLKVARIILEDVRVKYTQADLDKAIFRTDNEAKKAYLRSLKPPIELKPAVVEDPKPAVIEDPKETLSKTENRFDLHIYVHVKQE